MLEAAEKYLLYEIWPNGRLNSSLWGVLRSSWCLLMWIYLQVHLVIISAVFRATISEFVLSSYCVHVNISVLTTRKIMSVSFYKHISPLHCVLDVKRIQWCNPASSSVSSEQVRKQEFSVCLSVFCLLCWAHLGPLNYPFRWRRRTKWRTERLSHLSPLPAEVIEGLIVLSTKIKKKRTRKMSWFVGHLN